MGGFTKKERLAALRIMKLTGMDREQVFLLVKHSRHSKDLDLGSDSPEGERRT